MIGKATAASRHKGIISPARLVAAVSRKGGSTSTRTGVSGGNSFAYALPGRGTDLGPCSLAVLCGRAALLALGGICINSMFVTTKRSGVRLGCSRCCRNSNGSCGFNKNLVAASSLPGRLSSGGMRFITDTGSSGNASFPLHSIGRRTNA